jgi:transposase
MKNEIALKEKTMTTKELASVLGVSERTIRETAKNKGVESTFQTLKTNGGKQSVKVFTEEQATLIKQEIQKHHNLTTRKIDSVSTEMEMKQKAAEVIQWYMSSYEAEKELRLKAETENKMLKH